MKALAVSKVGLDPAGRITAVLWGQVDTGKSAWATPEAGVPVAAAVDALDAGDQIFAQFPAANGHLPDRQFVVADHDGSRKTIVPKPSRAAIESHMARNLCRCGAHHRIVDAIEAVALKGSASA